MAKRKLDLSGMYTNTSNIQDSNKITTRQIQDKNYEPHGKYEAYRRAEENPVSYTHLRAHETS